MKRFEGKRIVHTGGASGIGRATVLRLLEEGATVFTVDVSEAGLAETASAASGLQGKLVTHPADLASEEQIVTAAEAAVEALGSVDVLINGAGAMRPKAAGASERAAFQWLLDVNYLAPVTLIRELLPHIPDGDGVVVNVTSTSATKAHPGMTGYAASKGALLAYSVSLAAELAPRRIRVVPVSPGGISTPLSASVSATEGIDFEWFSRIHPLWGEMGKPRDIAAAIAFAASSDGAFLNGVELRVDGGAHT